MVTTFPKTKWPLHWFPVLTVLHYYVHELLYINQCTTPMSRILYPHEGSTTVEFLAWFQIQSFKNLPGKQIETKFPFSQLRSTGCLHSKLNRYQKYFSEIQKVSVISFFFFFIKIARSIHYANMATMWQFFFWGKTINWQSIQNQTHK